MCCSRSDSEGKQTLTWRLVLYQEALRVSGSENEREEEADLGRRRAELWCSDGSSLSPSYRELRSGQDLSELSAVRLGARTLSYLHHPLFG